MSISSFKDLAAYQKAYSLTKDVYRITEKFPKSEQYGMTSQIRRASVSVPLNISEGFMRGSKEYVHFLKIALGSAAEVETLLSLGKDLRYITENDFRKLYDVNLEVMKLVRTYIKRIANY